MISALLNKKIIFEKITQSLSSVLTPEPTYEEYIETFAGVYVRAADTKFESSEELIYTTEFTIRYTAKSKLIDNKYRIKYNNQYYKILEVIETESKMTLKFIAIHYGE